MSGKSTGDQKNKRLVWRVAIGVVLMFGFAYLLVPLYTLVCNKTGINGRSSNEAVQLNPNMKVDTARTIQVLFSTTVHGPLQFDFHPMQHHIDIHPGETKLVYFYAENKTGHGITIQAIPSISPDTAAKYLKKTQCFCFTQQYFSPNEKAEMPVYFYIDPEINRNVVSMSLSYTLFDATQYKKNEKPYTKGRIEL